MDAVGPDPTRGSALILVGTQASVAETIELTGFHHSVTMVDRFDAGNG